MPAERQQARGALQAANLAPRAASRAAAGLGEPDGAISTGGPLAVRQLGAGHRQPPFEGARHRAGLWLRQARDDLRAGTQLLAWATEELG